MILTADQLYPADQPTIGRTGVAPALRAVTMVLAKNQTHFESDDNLARVLLNAGEGRHAQLAHLFEAPVATAGHVAAAAYVDHGRWVVECPDPNCREAQAASPDDPRFFCTRCRNAGVGGDFVDVRWPDPTVRSEAERLLLRRPTANRNWLPEQETLDDLATENMTAGSV